VVISSDKPPKAIGGLEERLRSRFEGGLIADVQLPDYEMRTAILRAKGEELGVALPADVIEYVAQRDRSNIRELEGALNKILALAEFTRSPLSLQLSMEALTDASMRSGREKATVEEVIGAVCEHFGTSQSELRGRSRSKEIVLPRQVAMYLLREETNLSLADIGGALGGRDHTTVLHGIEKMERELQRDTTLRSHIMKLREALFTAP
jgi:chromosomal replication initiator protein